MKAPIKRVSILQNGFDVCMIKAINADSEIRQQAIRYMYDLIKNNELTLQQINQLLNSLITSIKEDSDQEVINNALWCIGALLEEDYISAGNNEKVLDILVSVANHQFANIRSNVMSAIDDLIRKNKISVGHL